MVKFKILVEHESKVFAMKLENEGKNFLYWSVDLENEISLVSQFLVGSDH